MKKLLMFRITLCFIIIASVYSCQKEKLWLSKSNNKMEKVKDVSEKLKPHRPIRGTFTTDYNFIPDIKNGWTSPNPAPAWYPGKGSGHLIHLGACSTFFNQYATLGSTGLQTIGAPVNMFFANELTAAGLNVSNDVTVVFYKENGNSIWCEANSVGTTVPVSPTRIEFSVQLKIIGGSGQFASATGTVKLSGYFNPADNQDAGFEVDGWISY